MCTPPWQTPFQADTPGQTPLTLGQTDPSQTDITQADTPPPRQHPTGMHSCLLNIFSNTREHKYLINMSGVYCRHGRNETNCNGPRDWYHQQCKRFGRNFTKSNQQFLLPEEGRVSLVSGGSRISPRRGCQLPRGAPTYDFAKFSQKLHEIERIWIRGACVPGAPLRSATASTQLYLDLSLGKSLVF